MTTSAISAFGTLLQYGDGDDPELFTTVAEITSLNPPEMSATMEDATSHDSEGGWEEVVPTTLALGDTEFTYNWIPADTSHAAVLAALGAAVANWHIAYPDFGTGADVVAINTETAVLTLEAHGFYTGQPVRFTTAGVLPTSDPQVDLVTTYFVGWEDADTFKLYPTNADAVAGTNEITFSSAGTGDQTINSGTVANFAGIVQGLRPDAPLKGKLGATARLKPSGPISFTPE